MNRLQSIVLGVLAMTVTPGMVASSSAIDILPSNERIRAALVKGKEAAWEHRTPDTFYVRFGSVAELHSGGFLMTKLGSLSVMALHMAARGVDPSQSDIAQVVEAPTMLVSVVIFGNVPSFAVDSYMVLDQGGKTIKPVTVRFDGRADRSPLWPDKPRFRAKVVASFNYADFDPLAETTIAVFPGEGGELRFSLDFAQLE